MKVKFPPSRSALRHEDGLRSGEGPALETSAFQIFYGGNSVWQNQIFMLHSPTAAPQFLKKQEILSSQWSSSCGIREPLMKYYGIIS